MRIGEYGKTASLPCGTLFKPRVSVGFDSISNLRASHASPAVTLVHMMPLPQKTFIVEDIPGDSGKKPDRSRLEETGSRWSSVGTLPKDEPPESPASGRLARRHQQNCDLVIIDNFF